MCFRTLLSQTFYDNGWHRGIVLVTVPGMPARGPLSGDPEGTIARHPTIHDVAANLGVSLSTVSLALNGKGTISAKTRERVVAEAARIGYVAHPMARGLRAGRTNVIALSIRSLDFGGSYRPEGVDHFSRMAGAAAFTALDRGFRLMLVPSSDEPADEDPRWADGYVIEDPRSNDPLIERLVAHRVPVVTIGWDPAHKSRTAWVSNDDKTSTRRVLDLLAARGAKDIVFVSGTEPNSWNDVSRKTYRAWSRERGRTPRVFRLPEAGGVDAGADLASDVMGLPDSPDAVFCQTGRHAAGFAQRCQEMGIKIPRDVLVAAGNDAEQARNSRPPITAVDLEAESLGREAVELLADMVLDGSTERSRIVPAQLIERASTRPRR
jgi:DNA-binding LacI/PurR family transcriptional regulator